MVKDHSDSERGNLLLLHGLVFLISSKGSFICIIPQITHTTAFVTPVMEHWLEREIAQLVHPMKDRSDNPSHHERTLLPQSYISLLSSKESFIFTITQDSTYHSLCYTGHCAISYSSQCSTTGVTKTVVCAILYMG